MSVYIIKAPKKNGCLLDGNKIMIFLTNGYNYLSGNEEQEKILNCIVKEKSYYLENYPIPIDNFKTEMKILEDNSIFLQTVSDKKIGETNFPIITQYNSSSQYRNYILPYFPNFHTISNKISFIYFLPSIYTKHLHLICLV